MEELQILFSLRCLENTNKTIVFVALSEESRIENADGSVFGQPIHTVKVAADSTTRYKYFEGAGMSPDNSDFQVKGITLEDKAP